MRTYREILLHAGLSKTGSTSIQDALAGARERLLNSAIDYPQFSFDDSPFDYHSIPLSAAVCAAPGRYGLGLRRRYGARVHLLKSELKNQLHTVLQQPKADRLILSAEVIENWAEEDLAALADLLQAHCQQLRVIVYLRSPRSSLASILQERAKAGTAVAPEAIIGRVLDKYQRLNRQFGPALELVDFHEAVRGSSGVVGSFLALAGAMDAVDLDRPVPVSNRGLSREAYQVLQLINREFAGLGGEVRKHPALVRDRSALAQIPGQRFRLEDLERPDLDDLLRQETDQLRMATGLALTEAEQVPSQIPLWGDAAKSTLQQILPRLETEAVKALLNAQPGAGRFTGPAH
jgi:hypothetical protein